MRRASRKPNVSVVDHAGQTRGPPQGAFIKRCGPKVEFLTRDDIAHFRAAIDPLQ
jgi:hypothetical protein